MMRSHRNAGPIRTPEYAAWNNMIQRCENRSNPIFCRYGGRGVKVCARWHRFELFLKDVGPRPGPEFSIDRFPNNDGNYEPGNVRWATRKQQARNMRSSLLIDIGGETKSLSEWSEISGILVSTIKSRIILGWPPERLLAAPATKMQRFEAFGESKPLIVWAREYGIKYGTLHARVHRYSMPIESALTLGGDR